MNRWKSNYYKLQRPAITDGTSTPDRFGDCKTGGGNAGGQAGPATGFHDLADAAINADPAPKTVHEMIAEQWAQTPAPETTDRTTGDIGEKMRLLKAELEVSNAIRAIHTKIIQLLTEVLTEHDNDVLEVALSNLVAVTELALERATIMDHTVQYWEQEREYTSILYEDWPPLVLDRVLWLLDYKPMNWSHTALQKLRASQNQALSFAGRVKYLLSHFSNDELGPEAEGTAGDVDRTMMTPGRQRAVNNYKLRVLRILEYSIHFLQTCTGKVSEPHSSVYNIQHLEQGGDNSHINGAILDAVSTVMNLRAEQKRMLRVDVYGIPSWVQQRKIKLALITTAITGGLCYGLYSNGAATQAIFARKALSEFCETAVEFLDEHLVVPVKNIKEYLLKRHMRSFRDPVNLEASKETLQRMLSDFVGDLTEMSDEERAELMGFAAQCDLRAISPAMTKEIRNPIRSIIAGDIVRLLLLNGEKMKLDLLTAMDVMDEVLQENTTTIELMAMLPLLVMGWMLTQLLEWIFTASRREQSARHDLRMLLRRIERTLIWQVQTLGVSTEPRGLMTPLPADFDQLSRRSRAMSGHNDQIAARIQHQLNEEYEMDGIPDSDPKYLNLGRVVFGVWGIEQNLRRNPEILNAQKGGSKIVTGTGLGAFFGGVFGVAVGSADVSSSVMGSALGALVGYIYVKQSRSLSRIHTFDANRFLEDVHELPSPKLSAEEKLHWMGYLWRFYDLNDILDPHR